MRKSCTYRTREADRLVSSVLHCKGFKEKRILGVTTTETVKIDCHFRSILVFLSDVVNLVIFERNSGSVIA